MAIKPPFSESMAAVTTILFLLRLIQKIALVLTAFVASYFVYWHNALRDPVPFPLIALITAVRALPLSSPIAHPSDNKPVYRHAPRSLHLLRHGPCQRKREPERNTELQAPVEDQHAMHARAGRRLLRSAADGVCAQVVRGR